MNGDSIRALHEELPAHGAWVRRLARGLVRDESAADDVAQDAALAALRRGGSIRGALEPWLARVARNLAHRDRRDESRRAERERAAARPESLPAADEAAARLEMQRALVDELAALEPAQRHALVRRYFDGWNASRIARESGEPAATVRWRLQRGLAELRARLDRRCRTDGSDGTQWRLALLPLCGKGWPWGLALEPLRPLIGGAIQGALTMKAASQALAAGTLVAAVGLGVWWNAGREAAPRAEERTVPAPAEVALADPPREAEPLAEAPAAAREALAAPEAPAAERTEPAAAASSVARLRGRVVDEAFVAVGGARVAETSEGAPSLRARPDGSFELEPAPNAYRFHTLRVEADGFATRWIEATLEPAETKELGDVVLAPGGSVRGRVLGPGGAPLEGATVAITSPDLRGSLEEARAAGPFSERMLGAESGPDGRFEVPGVGVGPVRAWASAAGMRWAVSAPIEVPARRASEEVELVLESMRADDRVLGIVLSPDDEPVPDARIGVEERAGGGITTYAISSDSEGRFSLPAKPGRVYGFRAEDSELRRWAAVRVSDVPSGTQGVELRFQELRWIDVAVRAPEGHALLDVQVDTTTTAESMLAGHDAGAPETRADGVASVRLQRPTEPFLVRVDARGFALATQGPFEPERAPESLEFELVPEPGVRGRVLAGGKPVAGARVTLHEAPADVRIEHQGYLSRVDPQSRDATATDADGRFTLKLRRPKTYVVRAEADGLAPNDSGPLELAPETGRDGLEIVLGKGGALEGRVLVAPGRDPSGVIVALNRGDAFPRTVRSGADGAFGFEGLTPGEWQLSRGRMEFNAQGGGSAYSVAEEPVVIPFDCAVVEGETTYRDLDLTDWEPCVVRGVLAINGAPAAGWSVQGWPGAANAFVGELPSTATAADGRFELTVEEEGALRLSFAPPAEAGGQGRIDVRIEVRPGANEWREDFAMGRLTGRCLSARPGEGLSMFYNAAEGTEPSCWLPIQPGADGRYELPFVPAGRGSVRRHEGNGVWATLIETEVLARRERVLDIP